MHMARLGLLLLVLVGLSGCNSSPAQAGANGKGPNALLIGPKGAADLGYTLNWATDLAMPASQHITDVRRLGDLIVLVEQPRNIVWAIAVRDGASEWERAIGDNDHSLYRASRYQDRVFVNSSATLYGMNASSGAIASTSQLEHTVSTGGTPSRNFLIFGAVDGRVFAHGYNTGFSEWAYQLANQIVVPPLARENRVFVADSRGVYAMLRADNGQLLWRNHVWGPITAQPAMDGNTVYVASQDQALYALAQSTGDDRWVYRTEVPLEDPPHVIGQSVLQPVGDSRMVAINKNNGEMRWELDHHARAVRQDGDHLLLFTETHLETVNPDTGEVLRRVETAAPLQAVLEGPNGSLILVSQKGRMLRLNRRP